MAQWTAKPACLLREGDEVQDLGTVSAVAFIGKQILITAKDGKSRKTGARKSVNVWM